MQTHVCNALKKTPEGNSIFLHSTMFIKLLYSKSHKNYFLFSTQVKLYESEVLFYKARITCLYYYAVGSESPK